MCEGRVGSEWGSGAQWVVVVVVVVAVIIHRSIPGTLV